MAITTIRTPERTSGVPDATSLERAANALLEAITAAGSDDPRWESAGPLVTAAAQRLREALGTPVTGSCIATPPIVREADLALAARRLLADPAVVDPDAARQFVVLSGDAVRALH